MRSLPWRSDPAYRLIDPCLAGRSPRIGATRQKGCAGRRAAAAAGPCLPVRMLQNRDGTDRREPGAWGGWRSSDRPADGARRGHPPSLIGTEIADIGLARPRARRPDGTTAGEISPNSGRGPITPASAERRIGAHRPHRGGRASPNVPVRQKRPRHSTGNKFPVRSFTWLPPAMQQTCRRTGISPLGPPSYTIPLREGRARRRGKPGFPCRTVSGIARRDGASIGAARTGG